MTKMQRELFPFGVFGARYEWQDPITLEVHRCPAEFLRVVIFLKTGRQHAQRADQLLRAMGFPVTGSNQRHLRQAMALLRKQGMLIFSRRSSKGGYYLASAADAFEVFKSIELEQRLGESMIRNANRQLELFRKIAPQVPNA